MADKSYGGLLRGICGDCDGVQNDLRLENGTDVRNVTGRDILISQSWIKDNSYFDPVHAMAKAAESNSTVPSNSTAPNNSTDVINSTPNNSTGPEPTILQTSLPTP